MRTQMIGMLLALFASGVGCAAANGDTQGEEEAATANGEIGETGEALSGDSCLAAVKDDGVQVAAICKALGSQGPYCALLDKARSNCAKGELRVYRNQARGSGSFVYKLESTLPPTSPITASFAFAQVRQPGASSAPLYRCAPRRYTSGRMDPDLLSDRTVAGACPAGFATISFHGYSYAPNTAGAKPVYRCYSRNAGVYADPFLSWSRTCEGQLVSGVIGYAKP
jgi:hypothetical protein